MRPITDRFATALRGPHLIATQCDLWFPGETVPVTVPIEDGTVTIDRTAMIRRTGQVQIPWALEAGADLGVDVRDLPYGGYCDLYRGLQFPGSATTYAAVKATYATYAALQAAKASYADMLTGSASAIELCHLGHYRIESVTWGTLSRSASLELADRMAQIRDEPFTSPYSPSATSTPITRTGTLANGSAVVTGLSSTTGLTVNMTVTGNGVPAGTRIQSIDSGSQITLTLPAVTQVELRANTIAGSPAMFGLVITSLYVGMVITSWHDNGTAYPGIVPAGTTIASFVSGQITMSAAALQSSTQVIRRFTAPAAQALTFSGATSVAAAAVDIVKAVFGTTIAYITPYNPNYVLTDTIFAGSRSDAIQQLAEAAGAEVYFDATGAFVFTTPPGDTTPVYEIDTGASGVLVDADESLARTGVYNGVVMTGQDTGTDPPVTALVTNNDATSPLRWGGPFGKVARVETSSAVQTTGQATAAATALLNQRAGLSRSLTLSAAPNPALEAGDVITVDFGDGRVETHLIDSVRLGLTAAGEQSLAVRLVDSVSALTVPMATQPRILYGDDAWAEARTARLVRVGA